MALDTFQGLIDSVRTWSKRKDAGDLLIGDFIRLAEVEMFANREEILLLDAMDTRSTATTSTTERFLPKPARYIKMRRLWFLLDSRDQEIDFVIAKALKVTRTAGIPAEFTVTSQVAFDRITSSALTVEMQFYARPPGLSTTNPTNFVLDDYPNIYLNGALRQLWKHFKEEELSQYYFNEFIGDIEGANLVESDGRYGPSPSSILENSEGMP